MSIYDSFTKRNSLIKTLRFRLKPMYGTEQKLQEMGVLEKDRERSACWPVVLDVLRRVDACFIEQALTDAKSIAGLNWEPLAELINNKALGKNTRVKLLRQQTELRKAVSKLLTGHSDYKGLVNPTKAIKMAAAAVQNEQEKQAVDKYLRFTTVLVDYFTQKKALFSHEERKTTIAYRIVHVNFPIYLENLQQLQQYADAGLDLQDKLGFALTINSYSRLLVQSQIDAYNKAINHINRILYRLQEEKQLPAVLQNAKLKLKPLQKQVLSLVDTKSEGFKNYAEMRDSVQALQKNLDAVLPSLNNVFQEYAGEGTLRDLQNLQASLLESKQKLFFQDQDGRSIISIKAYLDGVLALRRFLKQILHNYTESQDEAKKPLVQGCADAWELLASLPHFYNKVRSFLTRKPYKQDKIRLFFDCAAFGKGWDVNKEAAYLVTFFRKEKYYYLGVRRQGAKIDFEALQNASHAQENCYEKMVYKAFDFVKGMPAVVFSKLVLQKFAEGASQVVLDNEAFSQPLLVTRADFEQKYTVINGKLREKEGDAVKYLKAYLMKTGDEAGYKEAVYQRIELAKRFIAAYKAFAFFDMSQLRPTQEYTSWTEFISHVNEYTYGIGWQRVPEKALQDLVAAGDLFLFQLDNKDFAFARQAAQEDEQTLLLRNLFSDENKEQRVLKLLGDVEVYYRPASVTKKLMHMRGSILVNKKDTAHGALSPRLVRNVYKYLNGKTELLLPEAAALLAKGNIRWKHAQRDIIKDKRYTEDQMQVHFPVGINYRCPANDYSFNKDMRSLLKGNGAVQILGVHLGGDNLSEAVIIDQKGKLIYQRVYNEFNQYNYQKALALRKEERQRSQQSWLQMEKIKNIRLGYMAALVNEISKVVLQYNAIVVLEDFSKRKQN
ncbi:MAG: type V CRISPR-associated protein Cas12a/Cpf1, partial [Phascolarctobacterium sp.]